MFIIMLMNSCYQELKYKPTKLLIHNNSVKLSSKLQKNDNRTFYPFRDCLENLGATVSWDDVKKRSVGEYNGTTVEFSIGEKRYNINGVEYQMDTAAYMDNISGKTYIPIRYAAEALEFIVDRAETDAAYTVSIYR